MQPESYPNRRKRQFTYRVLNGALVLSLLTLIAPAMTAAGDGDAILGTWAVSDGSMKIEIYSCRQSQYCGRIAWMADDRPRVDERNPNPKKRSMSLIGMEVLWGLRYTNGKWAGGQIYHVADGKTYNCSIEQTDPATLQVQSFVGIAALGKTESWTR